jgi:ectoine hydroxylase-related dioxygenase (phytanoyl-CoA dioxygenase family)
MCEGGSMQIEGDYQRDGAVCLRGAFSPSEVALATEALQANMASLSPLALRASQESDGAFIEDFCSWQRVSEIEAFVRTSPAAAIAGQLMGSQRVRFFHDHVLVREPHTGQHTPWHQDLPYYNVDGMQNVSMWIPVDPVDASATLEIVAGSHLGPWYMPRSFLDQQAKWFAEGSLSELPDIAADAERFRILRWSLEPGDAICFHMLSLHAAAGTGATARRVLSLRFLGDDMVHAPRPWRTSPPFPGLGEELAAGVEMDHPLFPILWERSAQ